MDKDTQKNEWHRRNKKYTKEIKENLQNKLVKKWIVTEKKTQVKSKVSKKKERRLKKKNGDEFLVLGQNIEGIKGAGKISI